MNSATEPQLLAALTQLDKAVKSIANANPKPDLLLLFSKIDELAGRLPRDTDPTLLHYLHKKATRRPCSTCWVVKQKIKRAIAAMCDLRAVKLTARKS